MVKNIKLLIINWLLENARLQNVLLLNNDKHENCIQL